MSKKPNGQNESQEPFTVLVETLTGTTFKIKVSPQDRVRSIKCKLQRVEGIPISHQHLLYNLKELKDSACVTDPSVALHDKATVKLVLSMRGGPISLVHQSVPFNRTTLQSLINRREDTVDELPPGCKMAVLLLRVGDQLNLLHVVEDVDGLDCSESLTNDTVDPSVSVLEGGTSTIQQDNSRTMEKVCDLKEKMANISLQRKSHKTKLGKPSCTMRLPSIHREVKEEILKSRSDFSNIPVLPNITHHEKSSSSLEAGSEKVIDETSDSVRPKTSPSESEYYKFVDEVDCGKTIGIAQPHFRSCVSACSTKFHHEWTGRKSLLQSLNILPPISTISNVLNERRKTSGDRMLSSLSNSVSSVKDLQFNHQLLKSALKSRETVRKEEVNIQKSKINDEAVLSVSSENVNSPEPNFQLWNGNRIYSPYNRTVASSSPICRGFDNSSKQTVKNKVDFHKKHKLRCSECKKKLSLISTFDCRCGLTFCSLHRYSESHNCSYDFKKDSRKILEQANPSVVAPKLPKI